ncbi:MAG: FtsX-like permease family protein [Candidatus Dormibacteraceae bacterium]
MLTGLAGALLGIGTAALGIIAFALTNPSAEVTVPAGDLPIITVLCGLLCLIASVLPARRVMRMDCIEAIRAE